MFFIFGFSVLALVWIIVYLVSYIPSFVMEEPEEVKSNKPEITEIKNTKKFLPPNCIWRSELLGTYRKKSDNAI